MKKSLKKFWPKSIIALLAIFILIPQIVFSEEIRVLNWQGYGTDEKWSIDIFSSETGISGKISNPHQTNRVVRAPRVERLMIFVLCHGHFLDEV